MLVISRKLDERLRITLPDGRTVWAVIVEIGEGRVRIGIDAPRDVLVMRDEVVRRSLEDTQH